MVCVLATLDSVTLRIPASSSKFSEILLNIASVKSLKCRKPLVYFGDISLTNTYFFRKDLKEISL